MAYAESTVGGSLGGNYRVWVNSIRTFNGNAANNSEDWRVEGGLNKIATGTSAFNNTGNSNYTLKLGLNGVQSSGNFNYNFASGTTGTVLSWGTGTTKVYRNSAGVGFGFQSRMDINLSNSPFLTTGWVTANATVQTKLRHASLTALSTDAGGIPFTDEGPAWVEFSNPAGASVDAFLEAPSPGFPRIYTSSSGITSRFNFPFNSTLTEALQDATPNSNTATVRIGIHDALGGDNWDYRDRTYTIKNDAGQANPTFSDFTYVDADSSMVAITGDNQVLIQNESSLQVTVSTANKATPNKGATMSTYGFSIGSYSQSEPWSNVSNVVKTVGAVPDVSGVQNLSVRAVDSRGNSKTVTKPVTILPYRSPGFYLALTVKYTNEFDASDGLTATTYDTDAIAITSPLTLEGDDKNEVTLARFDLAKGTGSYTGTWVDITTTYDAGVGKVRTDMEDLADAILTKMNTIGADNTVPWYIRFQIQDKIYLHQYTFTIDVGRPILRIGTDSNLYHKEIEFHEEFNPMDVFLVPGITAQPGQGTWAYLGGGGYAFGAGMYSNSSLANGDYCVVSVYLNAGEYNYTTSFWGATANAIVDHYVSGGIYGGGTFQYSQDCYNAGGNTELLFTLNGLTIEEAGWYNFAYVINGKNVAGTTTYRMGLFGIRFNKVA